jgi:hypothetical protein
MGFDFMAEYVCMHRIMTYTACNGCGRFRIIKLPIMLPISFLSARHQSNNMNLSSVSIQPYEPLVGVVFVNAQNALSEACYQQPENEESCLNSLRPRLAQLEALNIIALRAQNPETR